MTTQPRSPGSPSGRIVVCEATTDTTVSVCHAARVSDTPPVTSPRRDELLERAYAYALGHGIADLSLRPLATAVGSSPRVLLFLFGSKDGLMRALFARARRD